MSRTKYAAILSGLVFVCAQFLFGTCAAQDSGSKSAQSAKPSQVFREATPINTRGAGDTEAFEFEMNGFSYHVVTNGNGRRVKEKRVRGFNLRVDGRILRVYFSEYRGDLLIVGELDNGGSGAGFVTLLEQPSMRARWQKTYPRSNVGEPARDGRHLFVTGNGFVAELDLETGGFIWQHDKLYGSAGPETFNAFRPPEPDGDAVSFRDRRVDNPAHRVIVNRKTGKIVRVE